MKEISFSNLIEDKEEEIEEVKEIKKVKKKEIKKKKVKKEDKHPIEVLLLELVKDSKLSLEDRARVIAEAMLQPQFGLKETHPGSLALVLTFAMRLQLRLSGASHALDLVTRRTGNWIGNTESDLQSVLKLIRNSKLLKEVKDESGDVGVRLYNDVNTFMINYNKIRQ